MKIKSEQAKFIEDYNSLFNVPDNKATNVICDKYKREHANEFRVSDWSIEKHRKKFMDWMSSRSWHTNKS